MAIPSFFSDFTPCLGVAAGLRPIDAIVLLLYLAAMVAIGVWFSRSGKQANTEQYLLGGRGMAWWLIGIAYMMTLLSTNSLVGMPGEAFNHGLTMMLRSIVSPLVAIVFFYLCTRFFFRSRVFTPFQYLEERFDSRVRLVGSLGFLLIRLFYLALVLFSSAKVFEGAAGWPVETSILVVGLIGLFYVFLGGMKAVVWSDFVQFLVMAGGLILTAVICVMQVDGGFTGVLSYAFSHDRGFEGLKDPSFYSFDPYVRLSLGVLIFVTLSDRLFYSSADQLSVQRLLSTASYKQAERSMWFSQALTIPVILGLWFLGLGMFAFYGQHYAPETTMRGDVALFHFVANHLPPVASGLFLAACLGAIMSTLDAGFHSLATVVTKDVYAKHWRKNADDADQLRFSKVCLAAIGLFAIGIALSMAIAADNIADSFMETMVFWISFQGVLAILFLLGATSCRVTAGDVLRAFAVGCVVTAVMVVWYLQSRASGQPISFLFVSVPGEVAMIVAGFLPAFWRKKLPLAKIDGLTLWTLNRNKKRQEGDNSVQQRS